MFALEAILEHFGLTGDQRAASAERARDVTVTAGAGSGKTRTLVARYVGLLSEGHAPRQLAAITFTEKAAREMRTRVRLELRRLSLGVSEADQRQMWTEIEGQMDSARIGTIHSLCAEILRAHPAEAGLDPRFGVTEESETVRLRGAAVEAALLWAVEQPQMRPLFETFSVGQLEQVLRLLLIKRLEVGPEAFDPAAGLGLAAGRLRRFLEQEAVLSILAEFRAAKADGSLLADAGDKLADQIVRLLEYCDTAVNALAEGQTVRAARALWQARQSEMALNVGKRASTSKEALRELRALYDAQIGPWLGGKDAPDEEAEARLALQMPLLGAAYARALEAYQSALRERQALDFDDLEAGALALLRQPAVAARWQAEMRAVLVDEFQDTNDRQRELVTRLCGDARPGRLFVVGDARQSIYRFRGADVTVFTSLQQRVRLGGGLTLDLDRTFRAHAALLEATGSLLVGAMGDTADPERPFYVPFSPLQPQRAAPRDGSLDPFVECVLGAGADSESGRQSAAQALAQRLIEMRKDGEIRAWDDVTLLFRASSGFPFYEEAFEAAGIPFVTVAGSGFYDRPEIRDLINLLRALSDPWDDQALAGFLRSPAVGLSDPGLYRLRYQDGKYQPLRRALEAVPATLAEVRPAVADAEAAVPATLAEVRPAVADAEAAVPDGLTEADGEAVQRALALLREFEPLADRLPVADLLRRLVARMDTLAVLAASRSRLWRNASKLLADARRSGLVRVRAFLEYIDALRDVGAREGEAAVEATESEAGGAVRLMTIHKSKGLEFPVVVLADAARMAVGGGGAAAYALPGVDGRAGGWAVDSDSVPGHPLAFRLAKHLDAQQSEAESGRLLYVAMTRAQEKLLVSGHVTVKEDGSWRANGWLQALIETSGSDVARCLLEPGTPIIEKLPGGGSWRVCLGASDGTADLRVANLVTEESGQAEWPESDAAALYAPLAAARIEEAETGVAAVPPEGEGLPAAEEEGSTEWIVPQKSPALVVGTLVHEALRRWRFAVDDDGGLDRLLRQRARQEGILEGEALDGVVRVSKILLARFRWHPLWREIQNAQERYLAIPLQRGEGVRYIDVLYRTPAGWKMIDFHTSRIEGEAQARAAVDLRRADLAEKRRAVRTRFGVDAKAAVCLLDVNHRVMVVEVYGTGTA